MHLPKSEQIVVARHDPARSAFPRSGSLGEAFQLGVRQRYRVNLRRASALLRARVRA